MSASGGSGDRGDHADRARACAVRSLHEPDHRHNVRHDGAIPLARSGSPYVRALRSAAPMYRPGTPSGKETAVARFVDQDAPDLFRAASVVGQPAISLIEALRPVVASQYP